jgi:hypothetical protein
MPVAGGIALLVIGAILTFALSSSSLGGVDLNIAGVILMLAGAARLLLPLLTGTRPRRNRPTARSRQDVIDEEAQTLVDHADHRSSRNPLDDDRRPWQE